MPLASSLRSIGSLSNSSIDCRATYGHLRNALSVPRGCPWKSPARRRGRTQGGPWAVKRTARLLIIFQGGSGLFVADLSYSRNCVSQKPQDIIVCALWREERIQGD